MIGLVVATALLSLLAVRAVLWYALHRGVVDRPNARSSHAAPTPRGGGLGLVLAFGVMLATARGHLLSAPALLAAVAVTLVGLVGWVDDHGGLSARRRLVVHVGAGLLLLPLLGEVGTPVPLGAFASAWWLFWIVSSINVVNFMDGIDGIIAVQGIVFGTFIGIVAVPGGTPQAVGALLAAACLGFLAWNRPPARIFLGDVGSGMLGALFVIAGGLLIAEGRVRFAAAFAPLIPLFLDAAVTLAQRAWRGERLAEAHRSHLYQRLANEGWGHGRVTIAYGAASLLIALGAARAPRAGLGAVAGVLVIVAAAGAAALTTTRRSHAG